MKRLVMVMPYRAYVIKAKQEGFTVFAIWDEDVARGIYGADAPSYLEELSKLADGFALTDFSNDAELAGTVVASAQSFGADKVYHVGAEESMLSTYRVAESLGKEVNSARSIELINDKLAMRRLLRDRGLSPVAFVEAPSWQESGDAVASMDFPMVGKPTALSGSRGVYLLRGRADYLAWGKLLERYDYHGPVMLEQYLQGPEFSVETLSCRGEHRVIGVTRKILGPPPLFVEMGHVHPFADVTMAAEMEEVTTALLGAAGYRCGPAHTEVIWTGAGPRIVESQARLGGDRIPQLVELSTGVDIERGIFQCLAGHFPDGRERFDVARISYFDFTPGTIRSINGIEAVRGLDFVKELSFHHEVGDELAPTVDWRSRHGYVVVEASDESEAEARVAEVKSRLLVATTPAAGTPDDCVGQVEPLAPTATV